MASYHRRRLLSVQHSLQGIDEPQSQDGAAKPDEAGPSLSHGSKGGRLAALFAPTAKKPEVASSSPRGPPQSNYPSLSAKFARTAEDSQTSGSQQAAPGSPAAPAVPAQGAPGPSAALPVARSGSRAWNRLYRPPQSLGYNQEADAQQEQSSQQHAEPVEQPNLASQAPPADQLLPEGEARITSPANRGAAEGDDADALFDWSPKASTAAGAKRSRSRAGAGAPKRARKQAAGGGSPSKKRAAAAGDPGTAMDGSDDDDDDGIVGGAEQEVPADLHAAPILRAAQIQGPDEPLMLAAEGADDGAEGQVPASINRYLRDYQREGIRFLHSLYARGLGGILADDMGLGKTVQTIGFLAAVLQKTGTDVDLQPSTVADASRRRHVLIVGPSSVLGNWRSELQTWGAFRVAVYHGPKRDLALDGVLQGRTEVLITSYGTYRSKEDALSKVSWHVAIFDEAHVLKEGTQKFNAAMRLNTMRRYGLTGTAMQNQHKELWSLLHWANPERIKDWPGFNRHYVKALKMGQKEDATAEQLRKAGVVKEQLQRLLEKYLLRRTKDNTIADQLPKKTDNIVFCRLAPLQMRAYKRVLASPDIQLLVRCREPCGCASGLDRGRCCHKQALPEDGGVLWPHLHMCGCDSEECKRHKPEGCPGDNPEARLRCPFCLIMPALSILQKISNHLELIKVDPDDRALLEDEWQLLRAREQACWVFGEDLPEVRGETLDRAWLTASSADNCGKMAALEGLLALWSSGGSDKVLLFCHSVKMLGYIEQMVICAGYSFCRLDGSTPPRERQALVERFNASESIFLFLISTTAGGLGLNLTSANKVVIVDPSWNPAHDLQAQDRAFRIGQRRNVSVYRLVAAGTLEEVIYTRQVYKQQQAAVAVEGAEEKRYFKGVQGMPEHTGELWGVVNLFKDTLDKVSAHDILDRGAPAYRIQEHNADELAGVAPEEHDVEDPEGVVEDVGIAQLASQMALDGSAPSRLAQGAPDPELDEDDELECLEDGGVLGMHKHERLLSRTSSGRAPRKKRAANSARGAGAGDSQRSQDAGAASQASTGAADTTQAQAGPAVMSALGSLAAWKGVTPVVMAQRLLGLTEAQRTALRREYAMTHLMQHPNRVPQNPKT